MARLSVDVDGMDDTLSAMESLPLRLREALADRLNRSAEAGQKWAKRRLDNHTSPFGVGVLRRTIRIEDEATVRHLEVRVQAGGLNTARGGFDYALSVEFGARPHFPPVEKLTGRMQALDFWVRRMNPVPRTPAQQQMSPTELRRDVAFRVAEHISEEGLDERPFMRPGSRVAKRTARREMQTVDKDLL